MDYIENLKVWNFWGTTTSIGTERPKYMKKLLSYTNMPEIIAVTGIRRSGKSTLLIQLIARLINRGIRPINTLYVNFEDPAFQDDFNAVDLLELVKLYKDKLKPRGRVYLFLDEVQHVKEWERAILTLYETRQNVKIFVSGSTSNFLFSRLSDRLSGRYLAIQVCPLDFSEYLEFTNNRLSVNNALDKYLLYGGFPRVVTEKTLQKRSEILIGYYNTILERDVLLKHNIRNKKDVKKVSRFILSNPASLVSTYKLEKYLGISNVNIQKYIQFLQESFLISEASYFAYSVKKQIRNPSKLFIADTGLSNLVGFTFSENKGKLLENVVYTKLSEIYPRDIFYWKNGTKVDFVIFQGNKVRKLINVTMTVDDPDVLEREFSSLDIAKKQFPDAETMLITLYNQSKQKDSRIASLTDFLLAK